MCSKGVAKCLLIVFNIVFFLLGLAALVAGVIVLVDKDFLLKYLTNVPVGQQTIEEAINSLSMLENLCYVLIAAGAFVFIIGACGLIGALKEVKCLLVIYAVIVFLILAMEITAGALAYVYGDEVETRVQTFMLDLIKDYYYGATLGSNNALTLSTDSTGISDAWDFAMAFFECCGAYNYTDFSTQANNWPGGYNYTASGVTTFVASDVPITCCKMVDNSVFPTDLANVQFVNVSACFTGDTEYSINTVGCYDKVKSWAMNYYWVFVGVGIAVGVIEVTGIISAIMMVRSISKDSVEPV